MLPRRIVALGVGITLLAALATASSASARATLIHNGDGTSDSGQPFALFAAASAVTLDRTSVINNGYLPHQASVLANYGCVLLYLNAAPPDQYRMAALKTYVEGGGTVVAIGEYGGTPAFQAGLPNGAMNATSGALGSTMSLQATTLDFMPTTTSAIESHPLMEAVTTLGYNATSSIALGAGGVALARTTTFEPFIAVQQLGAGRLVLVADSNVLVDSPDYYTPYNNGAFARNMCGDLSPPDITITTPPEGARYKVGQQNVFAKYGCTDEDDRVNPYFSDILYCTGPVPHNSQVNMSVAGAKQFTVNASDLGGNLASKTHDYVVDGTPPDITITVPEDGSDVVRGSQVLADFGCVDPDPADQATITFSTTPLGLAIPTTTTGANTFTVKCKDLVGNEATKTVTYNVVDESPPNIAVTLPKEDGTTRLRWQSAFGANYKCTDADGPQDVAFCNGTVAFGAFIPTGTPGLQNFTVSSADLVGQACLLLGQGGCEGNTAEKTVPYFVDASPPSIDITVPASGGRYNRGSQVLANYGCHDADNVNGFQDLTKCEGPVQPGAIIDTSSAGTRTFKVDAEDISGNTATKTHTYTIVGINPPKATIQSPLNGTSYNQGSAIPISYFCTDPDGPADIKSCTRDGSGPLDSQTPGAHFVTARAEDFAGNVATTTHGYWINPPPAPRVAAAPVKAAPKKVCKSRRSFTIRVKRKKGVKIRSATVRVNGKLQKAKKGKRFTGKVVLTGLKKGTYRVVIKVKLSNGKTETRTRRFRTCVPKSQSKK